MQFVNKDVFIKMVKVLGVEGAITQRHRGTGRTVRDVLALVTKLSEGKKVYIVSSNEPGKRLDNCYDILRQVERIARSLGMDINRYADAHLIYEPSGGQLRVCSHPNSMRGILEAYTFEEYKLHDC